MVETARPDPGPDGSVGPEGRGPTVTVHVHISTDTRISRRETVVRATTAVVLDGAPLTPVVVLYATRPELARLLEVLTAAVADLDTAAPCDDGVGRS